MDSDIPNCKSYIIKNGKSTELYGFDDLPFQTVDKVVLGLLS